MRKYYWFILFTFFSISSCSVLEVNKKQNENEPLLLDIDQFCETQESYKSLKISKIQSSFLIDDERYDAKLSIYYIPDSIVYFTAVNSGFEILRGAIFPDSLYLINRLEKIVYIDRYTSVNQDETISFNDIELLLNKTYLCADKHNLEMKDDSYIWDKSTQNVTRKINWNNNFSKIDSFQFFNKKTGEYVLGELVKNGSINIYSDYIIGPMEVTAYKGFIEYDIQLSIKLSVNRAKYSYFYLQ